MKRGHLYQGDFYMSDPTVTIGIKEIVEGGVLGLGGFFMWLLKKSIFGRMDIQDDKIDKLQTKGTCVILQSACQLALGAKIDSVDGKIDLVLDRQKQVINRIDSHINGHKHDS
jgi:hypothetical protein